jgi:hypothetical protein
MRETVCGRVRCGGEHLVCRLRSTAEPALLLIYTRPNTMWESQLVYKRSGLYVTIPAVECQVEHKRAEHGESKDF